MREISVVSAGIPSRMGLKIMSNTFAVQFCTVLERYCCSSTGCQCSSLLQSTTSTLASEVMLQYSTVQFTVVLGTQKPVTRLVLQYGHWQLRQFATGTMAIDWHWLGDLMNYGAPEK